MKIGTKKIFQYVPQNVSTYVNLKSNQQQHNFQLRIIKTYEFLPISKLKSFTNYLAIKTAKAK